MTVVSVTKNESVQRRALIAHNKLLLDVIKKQAGTLEKALLEAGMNALEAGSEKVVYTFDADGIGPGKPGATVSVRDWGKGFRSEKEIHEWFETFGQPHDDSENKTWAKFRMGRGQCFAFGRNVWRTGEFRMVVDIDNMGLEYELETGLPHFKGCQIDIELYSNPIGGWNYNSVDVLKSAFKRQIEFMEGEFIFNGEQINTPASMLKWDVETDDAYFMFGKGQDLAFYNLGAFVRSVSASQVGVTGVVVSKEQLEVNFARNDILHSCKVYQRISDVVRENKVKKVRKSRRQLNRNERISTLIDLRDGVVGYKEISNLGLIEMTNDRFRSLENIRKIRTLWSFAPRGDQTADTLMIQDQAVCFNEELLDELDYSGDSRNFFNWILREAFVEDNRYGSGKLLSRWQGICKLFRPFRGVSGGTGLADSFCGNKAFISQKKMTKAEKIIVRVLEGYKCWNGRAICVGTSDTALAWTDGHSYICLSRKYLKNCAPQYSGGAAHLAATMFHELSHTDSTEDTHHHGIEFYRNFHNIISGDDRACTSPAYIIGDIPNRLRRIKAEDWNMKQIIQEHKAKAARDKKLGLV